MLTNEMIDELIEIKKQQYARCGFTQKDRETRCLIYGSLQTLFAIKVALSGGKLDLTILDMDIEKLLPQKEEGKCEITKD